MEQEHTTNEGTKKRKGSEVWNYFTKVEPADPENLRATCNYCGISYVCHTSKNGTTTLNRHLSSCKKLLGSLDERQKTLLFKKKETQGECSANSFIAKSFSQQRCRDKLARMVVMDELPFSLVEGNGFVDFVNELQSKFIVPCRKTIVNDIFKLYVREKHKLEVFFAQLSSHVCLTSDIWTSIQNINYMVVTAHFIDASWILQKKIISFCIIHDHKGETIASILDKCLLDWKIERLLTVTVDNAAVNETAMNILVKKINSRKSLVLNGEFMHIRCFAHIVNLIVNSGLKEHNDSIGKIRKAVKYVRSSPARLQRFRACIDSVNITCNRSVCLDVTTRWNSTYLMLETAEKFEEAFEKLADCDINYIAEFVQEGILKPPPAAEDWKIVRELMQLLKVFYEVTLKVSSTLHVTSNEFFTEVCKLHLVIKKHIASDNDFLRSMALNMQSKLQKYWGDFRRINYLMYVAVVVDPRYKLKFVKHCLLKLHSHEKTNEIIMVLEDTIKRLYAEYKVHSPRPNDNEQVCTTIVDDFELVSTFRAELNSENDFGNADEVEKYLSSKLENFSSDSDLLNWWRAHTSEYLTLSQIARDVLVIPISTVASESAFSSGGRVLDSFRSSLAPKTVESLICLQSWIRDSDRCASIYESLEETTHFEKALDDIIADSSHFD